MAYRDEIAALRARVKVQLERVMRTLRRPAVRNIRANVIAQVDKELNAQDVMPKIIAARFRSSSAHVPGGPTWRPLAASTRAARVREGYAPGPPLYKSGLLDRNALRLVKDTFSLKRAPNWKYEGTGIYYARYVGRGTPKCPARPFLEPPNRAEMAPIMRLARLLVNRAIRALTR